MSQKLYASVGWTVEGVRSLCEVEDPAVGGWTSTITEEQAEEFLLNNQKYIQDRMVELGWEVLETLLRYDGLLKDYA